MKSTKYLVLGLVILISSNSFSQGSSWKDTVKVMFDKLDINKDGVLIYNEIKDDSLSRVVTFPIVDNNRDGKLDFEEYYRAVSDWKILVKNHQDAMVRYQAQSKGHFYTLDKNKDNVLSKPELVGRPIHENFNRVDRNLDGKITYGEFKSEHALWFMTKEFKEKRGIKSRAVTPSPSISKAPIKKYIPKPRFNYEKFSAEELFSKFDTNGNGKIEREEAKTENSFNTDFSRMDKNGDEELTKKELQKYLASK